ncbi:MAG: class I SAM-dependent methyltransferase [Alphaproteobacteria bacterium]|nr:class I SAM-dependent methyltransferase [Alphaproteobacteria bacterium]
MKGGIPAQFARPTGWLGHVAGWIMAHRESNRARTRWTVDLLALAPSDRVLELGHGPGLGLALAAERAREGLVVGLDHSEVMQAQAAKRNRAAIAAGRVRLFAGGIETASALPGPFDKAFSVNVLMFLPERVGPLRALRAALKPGGLLATTYQPRHRGATAADATAFADRLERELTEAGYADARRETLPLSPVPAVCVLARA